jgi:hypothetical protein
MAVEVPHDRGDRDYIGPADVRNHAHENRFAHIEGTRRSREQAAAIASSRRRVFSELPNPCSTNVSAPEISMISFARSDRIARSARVG